MQLADDGRLYLDAPICFYLPWFQIADEKAAAEITVRQLLYQTSGFSETDGEKLNFDSSMDDDALAASMKRLTSTELINAPGSAFEYSNINYGILVLQRDFILQRDFGYYNETLPLRGFEPSWSSRERVRLRCEQ